MQLATALATVLLAVLVGEATEQKVKSVETFTLATFNVRYPGDAGALVWQRRMPRVSQIVLDHGFDVFGVQEAVPCELEALKSGLPAFEHVGCGRGKDRRGGGDVHLLPARPVRLPRERDILAFADA